MSKLPRFVVDPPAAPRAPTGISGGPAVTLRRQRASAPSISRDAITPMSNAEVAPFAAGRSPGNAQSPDLAWPTPPAGALAGDPTRCPAGSCSRRCPGAGGARSSMASACAPYWPCRPPITDGSTRTELARSGGAPTTRRSSRSSPERGTALAFTTLATGAAVAMVVVMWVAAVTGAVLKIARFERATRLGTRDLHRDGLVGRRVGAINVAARVD